MNLINTMNGEILYSIRKYRKITQSELARMSNVSLSTVVRIEKNEVDSNALSAFKIAQALKVPMEVFDIDEYYQPEKKFAYILSQLRFINGLSINQVSNLTGVQITSLMAYEKGKYMPRSEDIVIKLSEIYNVPANVLLSKWEPHNVIFKSENNKMRCTLCKEYKDLSEFHANPGSSSGKYSKCKTCREIIRLVKKQKEKYAN